MAARVLRRLVDDERGALTSPTPLSVPVTVVCMVALEKMVRSAALLEAEPSETQRLSAS